MTFLNQKYQDITPYTPGEQVNEGEFIKLNTNESPYPPAPSVESAVAEVSQSLNRYSDITVEAVAKPLAQHLGVKQEQLSLVMVVMRCSRIFFKASLKKASLFQM